MFRRLTCSIPSATLPQTILVGAGFRFSPTPLSLCVPLPAFKEPPPFVSQKVRERTVLPPVGNYGLFSTARSHRTPLRSLWMRGRLVSAPLKTAHSCAGCVPVLSSLQQPTGRDPAGTTPTECSSWDYFLSDGSFPECRPPTASHQTWWNNFSAPRGTALWQ